MKKLLWLCFFASGIASADPTDALVPYGVPKPPVTGSTFLVREAYVVGYYDGCKAPFYSAEHLYGKNIGGTEPRRQFSEDAELPAKIRATNRDYVGSGYDRGHMAPAADFQDSHREMSESFLLSNAVPQAPTLNRGAWKRIEMRTRAYAEKFGDVYVITGGVYGESPKKIGSGVCVPSHTYKVIIDKKSGQSVGFIAPNDSSQRGNPEAYQVPVSAVERASGIDFTPDLDGSRSSAMKGSVGEEFSVRK